MLRANTTAANQALRIRTTAKRARATFKTKGHPSMFRLGSNLPAATAHHTRVSNRQSPRSLSSGPTWATCAQKRIDMNEFSSSSVVQTGRSELGLFKTSLHTPCTQPIGRRMAWASLHCPAALAMLASSCSITARWQVRPHTRTWLLADAWGPGRDLCFLRLQPLPSART